MSFELLAEVTRNQLVESRHFGAIAVCDFQGNLMKHWGDVEQLIFPRSALKPFFAIGLVESGAVEHYNLSDKELALACASHSGEGIHSDGVAAWLKKLGLNSQSLACGAVLPDDVQQMVDILAKGENKCRLHHNCSGKHTSFLTQTLMLNENLKTYHLNDHPVQVSSLKIISDLIKTEIQDLPMGIDGCGFPAPTMTLKQLAQAAATFAKPQKVKVSQKKAIYRLHDAMKNKPFYVAGHGCVASDIIHITQGGVLAKTGAEGVIIASIPKSGIGIAIKIADGSARARGSILIAILELLGLLTSKEKWQLRDSKTPQILNSRNEVVGEIRPVVDA